MPRQAWAAVAASYEDAGAADPGASHAALAAVATAAVVGDDTVDVVVLGADPCLTYVCT